MAEPQLIPVVAPLDGHDALVIAAGVVADGIVVVCQRPVDTPPRLVAPGCRASLSDDGGTGYSTAGANGGMDGTGQESNRFDFRPSPPAATAWMTFSCTFESGLEASVRFPLAPSTIRSPAAIDRPWMVMPCDVVIDPDGEHPVRVFGLEAWMRHTVVWAVWRSERGSRYVLSAGGCGSRLGGEFTHTPPGVSAARIPLPFAVSEDADHLDIAVRLGGRPGAEATARLAFLAQ